MATFHFDHASGKVVEGRAGERPATRRASRGCTDGGVSFQFPPGWDDGSGKIRHVPDGPLKGRVCFSSRREAVEIQKRYEGLTGERARYDPD